MTDNRQEIGAYRVVAELTNGQHTTIAVWHVIWRGDAPDSYEFEVTERGKRRHLSADGYATSWAAASAAGQWIDDNPGGVP